jgi:hypothetical protein
VGDGDGGAWVWTRGGGEAGGERSGAAAPFIVIGRAPGRIGCGAGGIGARGGGARARGAGYAGAAAATAMPARVWGFMRAELSHERGREGRSESESEMEGGGGGGSRADTTTEREETKTILFSLFLSFCYFCPLRCDGT